jgi:microcystin-dependent protein
MSYSASTSTVSLTTNSEKLVINKPVVADSINVTQLNVTNDIYMNDSVYTPVGSILTYAGAVAPVGWLICDGSEVSKASYPRLFAVVGNLYGSPVNSANFVLPNLADRVPVGKSVSSSLGNTGGNSTLTLSASQLPSHTHNGTTAQNGSHNHTGTTDSAGTHTHTITCGHIVYRITYPPWVHDTEQFM